MILAFIFVQSALSADLSRAESGLITEWLAGLLKADPEIVSFVVRKSAHFLEYLGLGISLSFTVREFARLKIGSQKESALKISVSDQGLDAAIHSNTTQSKDAESSNAVSPNNISELESKSSTFANPGDTPEFEAAIQSSVSEWDSKSSGSGGISNQFFCGLIAWGIGTLYAVSDEIHQVFIDGRSCELRDIAIDAGGVLLGVLIIHLIWRAHRNHRQNN